jgi:uncharacterized membrane protein YesL
MPEEKPHQDKNIFPETKFEESQEPKNFKDRFMNSYFGIVPLFMINLVWFLLSLPIFTIFPALGGLYFATLVFERENTTDWNTVWVGIKKHWWMSLKWGLLVSFGYAFLIVNIWFYLNLDQGWSIFALSILGVILIFWSAINQFSFPLLLLQKEKKIFLALRNSSVIVIQKPLSALWILLLSTLISIVSTLLPPLWIFISMALIVRLQTKTVLKAMDQFQ